MVSRCCEILHNSLDAVCRFTTRFAACAGAFESPSRGVSLFKLFLGSGCQGKYVRLLCCYFSISPKFTFMKIWLNLPMMFSKEICVFEFKKKNHSVSLWVWFGESPPGQSLWSRISIVEYLVCHTCKITLCAQYRMSPQNRLFMHTSIMERMWPYICIILYI